MTYLILGRIDPARTAEGRLLARSGQYDPPPEVRHLFEYEEPDGSYFEVVESHHAEPVQRYMQKSAHLFTSMELHTAAVVRVNSAVPDRPLYALFYVSAGEEQALGGDEQVRAVDHISYGERQGILIIQSADHASLYRYVARILPLLADLRVVPIMRAEQVWKTVLGAEENPLP